MKSKLTDIEVAVHRDNEHEKAILVSLDGDRDKAVWLPRSQVEIEYEVSTLGDKTPQAAIALPIWLAKDKGLI